MAITKSNGKLIAPGFKHKTCVKTLPKTVLKHKANTRHTRYADKISVEVEKGKYQCYKILKLISAVSPRFYRARFLTVGTLVATDLGTIKITQNIKGHLKGVPVTD